MSACLWHEILSVWLRATPETFSAWKQDPGGLNEGRNSNCWIWTVQLHSVNDQRGLCSVNLPDVRLTWLDPLDTLDPIPQNWHIERFRSDKNIYLKREGPSCPWIRRDFYSRDTAEVRGVEGWSVSVDKVSRAIFTRTSVPCSWRVRAREAFSPPWLIPVSVADGSRTDKRQVIQLAQLHWALLTSPRFVICLSVSAGAAQRWTLQSNSSLEWWAQS